jgi:hypothetical protein
MLNGRSTNSNHSTVEKALPRIHLSRVRSSAIELSAYPETDQKHQPKRTSVRFDRIKRGVMNRFWDRFFLVQACLMPMPYVLLLAYEIQSVSIN